LIVRGTWGKRDYGKLSPSEFYDRLYTELVESGVLPSDAPHPSRKYHQHVTLRVMTASWIEDRWVPDESLADRLRRLRNATGLSQEKFAEKHNLSVGTIKALESGARGSNATWGILSAIAKALDKPITIFCGVEGFDPEKARD
jgi:DNA-binding XRE family transcriptional regulator